LIAKIKFKLGGGKMKKKKEFVPIEIEIPQKLYKKLLKIGKTEKEVKKLVANGVEIFFTEICNPKDLLEALKTKKTE
jgi:hypothetical protein